MNDETLKTVNIFCPNCGAKNTALVDEDNGVKFKCNRCNAVIYSKRKEGVIKIKMIPKR